MTDKIITAQNVFCLLEKCNKKFTKTEDEIAILKIVIQAFILKANKHTDTRAVDIMRKRFFEGMTLDQVGKETPNKNSGEIGISRDGIRKIQLEAINKLLHPLRLKTIRRLLVEDGFNCDEW